MATQMTVRPLATGPVRATARSGFAGSSLRASVRARVSRNATRKAVTMTSEFPSDWLKKDPLVFVAGFLGWTIPANIPVSALGGNSLFGAFTQSIGAELAHWPTGPALGDSFWLYLVTYHTGLFLALTLGQIGAQARKQGYF